MNSSLLLAAGVALFATSCKKATPTVTADKTTLAIGEIVNLTCVEADAKVKGTFVTWNFGDGGTTGNGSTAEVYNNNNPLAVSYAYSNSGTYTVSAVFNKSMRPTKKNAKSTYGSTTITVEAIAPVFEVVDAAGTAVSSVQAGQALTFNDKSTIKEVAQADIWYTWYDNGAAIGAAQKAKTLAGYVPTSGKHSFKMSIMQGASTTWSTATDVTVGGQSLSNSELQRMIGGVWSVSATGNFSGYTGTGFCIAPSYNKKYSSITLDQYGSSTSATVAYPSSQAGNIETGNVSIVVNNSGLVYVSGIESSGIGNGLYTTTVSGSSMTLTRVYNSTCSSQNTTDTYTITLTR